MERTNKGPLGIVSWTRDETRIARETGRPKEECCGGIISCTGTLFGDEEGIPQGWMVPIAAWARLKELVGRLKVEQIVEEVLNVGGEAGRCSSNVRVEEVHGLIVRSEAVEKVADRFA